MVLWGRGEGCSIKAGGVPCSTRGVQFCGERGEGCCIKADRVPCRAPGVQCCGEGGRGVP